MKNILIACTAILAFTTTSFGQFTFGAGTTYATNGGGFFGVQTKVMYDIEDLVNQPMEAVGAFSYYFVNRGSLWNIDL